MAVPKRLRYEVMRRDNHACRYCGAAAPDAKLTIDHVLPVSLGGSDEPSNLVTACVDCNAGKAASNPDAPLVADVDKDARRWAIAVRSVAETLSAELDNVQAYRAAFFDEWKQWSRPYSVFDSDAGRFVEKCSPVELPDNWVNTVDRFRELGVPDDILIECVRAAMRANNIRDTFRYFCGVTWRRVHEIQAYAAQVVEGLEAKDREADA